MDNKDRLRMKAELKILTPDLDIKEILNRANPLPLSTQQAKGKKPLWRIGFASVFATLILVFVVMLSFSDVGMDKVKDDDMINPEEGPNDSITEIYSLYGFVGVSVVYLDQKMMLEPNPSNSNSELLFINPYVSIYDTYRTVDHFNNLQKVSSNREGYDYRLLIPTERGEMFVVYYKRGELLVVGIDQEYVVQIEEGSKELVFTYVGNNQTLQIKGKSMEELIVESDHPSMADQKMTILWDDGAMLLVRKSLTTTKNYKIEATPRQSNQILIDFETVFPTQPDQNASYGKIQAESTGSGYLYKGYIGDVSLEEVIPNE